MTSLERLCMNLPAEKYIHAGDLQVRRGNGTEIGHAPLASEAARQDLGLFVGRLDEAVDAAAMLRAFTESEDVRVAGGEPVIDHDPAIDREPCLAGELRIRPYANSAN